MNVFVYGSYGQNSLGDDVFKVCIQQLCPDYTFTFGNFIPSDINIKYDQLWLGGGDFLDLAISNIETVVIPIYFIGIGINPYLPPHNRLALQKAKWIVVRDSKSLSNSPNRVNTLLASDLVFSRSDLAPLSLERTNQITVLLNDFLTPVGEVPDWKSLSYYWFLQEFAKILDRYVNQDYTVKLIPMCINSRIDDRRIAGAVQGRSMLPQHYDWRITPISESELRTEISKSAFVVTQRFHGLIYSLIEQTPCIPVCAHDKFNSLINELKLPCIDYYGITDVKFRETLNQVMESSLGDYYSSYIETATASWNRVRDYIKM